MFAVVGYYVAFYLMLVLIGVLAVGILAIINPIGQIENARYEQYRYMGGN